MEIEKLSPRYAVRALGAVDAEAVYRFCAVHDLYYLFGSAEPTLEQVRSDMTITPPGVGPERKHYIGFFDGGVMAAVMDIVEAYPDEDSCYIGFFMVDHGLEGQGLGSAIISDAAACLASAGVKRLRLAIAKDNPQANHFWRKNGFEVVREADMGGWTALVADRRL